MTHSLMPMVTPRRSNLIGTVFSATLTADSNGWNNFTDVTRFSTSALIMPTGSPSLIKVYVEGGSSEGMTIAEMWVGHKAAAGDQYDFAATPTQLLCGGSASKVIAATTTEIFEANFAYNKTDDLVIAWYCNGGTGSDMTRFLSTGLTGIADWQKSGNDAATVNKTGYSADLAAGVNLIKKIEMNGF